MEAKPHAILIAVRRMLRFRRITTQNRLIAQIDGLRFVAIAWVVFFTLTPFFRIGAPFPLPCL